MRKLSLIRYKNIIPKDPSTWRHRNHKSHAYTYLTPSHYNAHFRLNNPYNKKYQKGLKEITAQNPTPFPQDNHKESLGWEDFCTHTHYSTH